MKKVRPGDRIYVRTLLFEGWATVTDVFPGELYPIQITLDKPDGDGHRIKRVSIYDIVRENEIPTVLLSEGS
jgi:hypothetical protein